MKKAFTRQTRPFRTANFQQYVYNSHQTNIVEEYNIFLEQNFNFLNFLSEKFYNIIPIGTVEYEVISAILETYLMVGNFIEYENFKNAIIKIQEIIKFAEQYYESCIEIIENFSIINGTIATYITTYIAIIINISNICSLFLPDSSNRIYDFFGISSTNWDYISIESNMLKNPSILFIKID